MKPDTTRVQTDLDVMRAELKRERDRLQMWLSHRSDLVDRINLRVQAICKQLEALTTLASWANSQERYPVPELPELPDLDQLPQPDRDDCPF
jgi:hypothetical protein